MPYLGVPRLLTTATEEWVFFRHEAARGAFIGNGGTIEALCTLVGGGFCNQGLCGRSAVLRLGASSTRFNGNVEQENLSNECKTLVIYWR